MARRRSVSSLGEHVQSYLTIRRALGFKLINEGRMLNDFVAFADTAGETTITIETALLWAKQPRHGRHAYLSQRMRAVRGFARYLHGLDPSCEVPPLELLPARKHRPTPYIYTDEQIIALLQAARRLRPPMRAATSETLIGLLACTGIRIGEAFRLDREDIDWAHKLLVIRDSKFGKSREVLLHASTIRALAVYADTRDRLRPTGDPRSVFISTRGTRLGHRTFNPTFHAVLRLAGLEPGPLPRPPRAHDLRHTFAVKTLLGWYRDGTDVAAKMPLLSTYLGHVDPVATYWYLSASPELLGLAARRLELASEQRSADEVSFPVPWAGRRSSRACRQRMARKDER
jgi:integrase/recombinase XerD